MKKRSLPWIPRILIICYILFISIFSLDATSVTGFFIHIIPSVIFAIILTISWRDFRLAAVLFALAGVGTIFFFNTYRDLFAFLIISIVPILIGILFWISNAKNKKSKKRK